MRTASHFVVLNLLFSVIASVIAVGCVQGTDTDVAGRSQALAVPGPWRIPASTVAIGDMQTAELTEAGPWVGPSGCYGGYTDGARNLAAYIRTSFLGVTRSEGYACRAIRGIPTEMSVHATGRAIDVFIPKIGSEADNGLGDPVGNWLIEHAEEVGIQRVIWDRWTWWSEVPPGYSRSMPYNWEGSAPHDEHLHIELTVAGGNRATDFFAGPMAPPTPAACAILPSAGGIIDDVDPCFQASGNPDFWRAVTDRGYGGSSLWTNAWQNDTPGNSARWAVRTPVAGDYELSVNTVAEFAVYDDVRYEVRHEGTTSTVLLDQSSADGWRSLGVFRFGGISGESVSVYDNYRAAVAADQHISVDALRVTWAGSAPPPDAGMPPGDAAAPPGPDGGGVMVDEDGGVMVDEDGGIGVMADGGAAYPPSERDRGGCAVAAAGGESAPSIAFVFIALAALAAGSRRRRCS